LDALNLEYPRLSLHKGKIHFSQTGFTSIYGNIFFLIPESCTKYRSEAAKALFLKRSWSDFDPQAYYLYGEDQNHETSFKGRALQAVADSWCKIQVITRDKCYTQFSANANTILSLTSQALRYIGIQRGYNDSLLNRKKNHWLSFEEISVKSEKEAEGG
jgi:hypothetical protein